MSLPKMMSPADSLGLIELESIALEKAPISDRGSTAPDSPKSNRSRRQLSSETIWNCDVHDRSVRRHPRGIRRDRVAGSSSERYGRGLQLSGPSTLRIVRVQFRLLPASRRLFLNFSNIDLVCLQHEYGIFGGRAGAHILELLRRLNMPFVTTLHTVLRDPDPDQRAVLAEL
jgi:hypothetical protein